MNHTRTIIHVDIDCFYAQVEMNKQPTLRRQPLGIQQKNIVVTSNYIAREYGVKKCMPVSEAKSLCPALVLVNGEDLYDYRHVSVKVSELLQEYSHLVERLGLDENFIDVTNLVNERLGEQQQVDPVGCIFGDESALTCDCGCSERLSVGSQIAQQMREQIYERLQLTTCAGIAHNKLLAKIVGTKNKPNNQTLLFPNSAAELMLSLGDVKHIPWVGHTTTELLSKINICKVEDLQNCGFNWLESVFDALKAKSLINLSFGIDESFVKKSGRPQSIGLEDACKALTTEKGVEEKLKELLARLLILVKEDGRIPKVMKLTIRKLDRIHPAGGNRESRQCNINVPLNNGAQLVNIALSLFRKAVDVGKTFKINLVGLAFSKFVEKPNERSTLVNFLSKGLKKSSSMDEGECSQANLEPPKKRGRISNDDDDEYPPGVDKEVFKELPVEMQRELLADYKRKKPCKKTNTILNYVVRQPNK